MDPSINGSEIPDSTCRKSISQIQNPVSDLPKINPIQRSWIRLADNPSNSTVPDPSYLRHPSCAPPPSYRFYSEFTCRNKLEGARTRADVTMFDYDRCSSARTVVVSWSRHLAYVDIVISSLAVSSQLEKFRYDS